MPCNAEILVKACGCDGTQEQWGTGCAGVPEGLAPMPVAHTGPCADLGAPCVNDGDCGPGLACGYSLSGGCGANGQCEPNGDGGALCNHPVIDCSCTGQTLILPCNGFTDIYAPEPIQHVGTCSSVTDAGAGGADAG